MSALGQSAKCQEQASRRVARDPRWRRDVNAVLHGDIEDDQQKEPDRGDGDYDRRNDRDMNDGRRGRLILRGVRAKCRCAFQYLF